MHRPVTNRNSRGFTLVELLTVIVVIGLLSSVGYVSYESVKVNARDTKRVSDVKQIQTALELFFENHSYYPSDGTPGDNGQLLGFSETKVLTDSGFMPSEQGTTYMLNVPRNPRPGGIEYVYRSLYKDGRNCHSNDCETYAVLFTLEARTGSLSAGPHALTPDGIVGEQGGGGGSGIAGAGGLIIGLQSTQELVSRYTLDAARLVKTVAEDQRVKTAANITAPTAAALALANTALTAYSSTSAASLLLYLFTQPFMLFGRRKRQAWGVVYNSLSKLPVDLAVVRLLDAGTGQRIKSAATDPEGRFSFLVPEGTYRLEVAKKGFTYPSHFVVGVKEDGKFVDVHSNGDIIVPSEGALLTPNVPVDPMERDETDRAVIRRKNWKHVRQGIAVLSPALGTIAFVAAPGIMTGLLFAAQLTAYGLFKRLAVPKELKQWGFVYEKGVGRVVSHAVLRIFALPYHKLVDSQVADRQGRYHFRVGSGKFYLTAIRKGYEKTESEPLDLHDRKEPTVLASNIPLVRSSSAASNGSAPQSVRRGLIVGPNAPITEAPTGSRRTASADGSLDGLLPPEEKK